MKIVKVIWADAAGLTEDDKQWYTLEESKKRAEELYNIYCETVGEIIFKNDKYIIISATQSGDQYSDMSLIPLGLIIKIVNLR